MQYDIGSGPRAAVREHGVGQAAVHGLLEQNKGGVANGGIANLC